MKLIHTPVNRLRQAYLPLTRRRVRRLWSYISLLVLGSFLLWGSAELLTPTHREAVQAAETIARASNPWSFASFPVENFQAYTSPFGYRQSPYGGRQFHYGLDIAAPSGSYIRTWWSGRVIEVSDDSACGTSVVIDSGEWTHIYCHMQGYVTSEGGQRVMVDQGGNLRIRQGAEVETGQPIGRVGMTGRTTGPHLHWGLKYQGSWVDPALVLQAMYDDQQAAAVR
jgi:murein DD-endopeptidase MepM/ murein hydrolase activator NlpD